MSPNICYPCLGFFRKLYKNVWISLYARLRNKQKVIKLYKGLLLFAYAYDPVELLAMVSLT
jgi:hypothetical protein